ncbi:hypothetical protein JCM10908_005412 [Rhodotorula pacifica]|uniref:uncharacterized protein n=1 Tax=Rhodotorula pacifica TaxID=1495444 RepID=UPI0031809897
MSSSNPAAGMMTGWDVQVDGRYVVYTRREHGSGLLLPSSEATAEHARAHERMARLGCEAYAELLEHVSNKLIAVTLGNPGNRLTLYHPGNFEVHRFASLPETGGFKTLVAALEVPVGNGEAASSDLYPNRRVLIGPGRLRRTYPYLPMGVRNQVPQDNVVAGPRFIEGVLYERGHNSGFDAAAGRLEVEEFEPNPRNPLQFMSMRATEIIDAFIERRQEGDESDMQEGEDANVAMDGHLSKYPGSNGFSGHAWQIGNPLEDMLFKHSPPRSVEWGFRVQFANTELATTLEYTLDWEQALREPARPKSRGSRKNPHVLRRGGTNSKRGSSSGGRAASNRARRGGRKHEGNGARAA